MKYTRTIHYQEVGLEELGVEERELVETAKAATQTAYSPYSHFRVGAAVRLANGAIVSGSNQENVAYPSGLCAERTALFSAAVQYPDVAVTALAIVGCTAEGHFTAALPCGACRQVMAEQRLRQQGVAMRIFCYQTDGKIVLFDDVEDLLPFAFTM